VSRSSLSRVVFRFHRPLRTLHIAQLAWIFENDDFNIVVGSLALQLVTGLPHLIKSLPL
jgi:hypothetical protein